MQIEFSRGAQAHSAGLVEKLRKGSKGILEEAFFERKEVF